MANSSGQKPTFVARPEDRAKLHGRNYEAAQNVKCILWFDRWENLEATTIPADPENSLEAVTVVAHIGSFRSSRFGPTRYPYGDPNVCKRFQKPNSVNRARPRCPECGHGKPTGHKGRACPAWEGTGYNCDGYFDADVCGCTYQVKKAS